MNDIQKVIAAAAGVLILVLVYFAFSYWKRFREKHNKAELGAAIFFSVLLVVVIVAETVYIRNGLTAAEEQEQTTAPSELMTQTTSSIAAMSSDTPAPTGIDLGIGWYEGEFSGRFCNGIGKMEFKNGDIYNGRWDMGEKDGRGTFYYARSGDIYCGEWKEDSRTGRGLYIWNASDARRQELLEKPDLEIDDAYLLNLDISEPHSFYYGSFADGYMEEGTYYLWKGEMETVDSNGNLIIAYQRRSYYTGSFKKDRFDGEGIFTYDNGDRFEGTFEAGMLKTGTFTIHETEKSYHVENGIIEMHN